MSKTEMKDALLGLGLHDFKDRKAIWYLEQNLNWKYQLEGN